MLVALVLLLSAAAHHIGGGHLPGLGTWAPLAAVLAGPVALLTRHRLSARRLLPAMLLGQLVCHAAFSWSTASPTSGASGHGGHLGHGRPLAVAGGHQHEDLRMLLAHLVAGALVALVVAHAEQLLWRLVGAVVPRRPRPLVLPITRQRRALVPVLLPTTSVSRTPRPVRGPPVLV